MKRRDKILGDKGSVIVSKCVQMCLAAVVVAILGSAGSGVASAAVPEWKVLSVTGPTNLPPRTSEVQVVAVDAAGGSFALSFDGETTAFLPFDADASKVQAALSGLTALGAPGSVSVVGGPGNPDGESPYFVTFGGALAGVNVDTLIADGSQLTGAAPAVSVSTATEGAPEGFGRIVVYVTNVSTLGEALPISLTIGPLPAGITISAPASGNGWSCTGAAGEATATCSRTSPVPAIEVASPVILPVRIAGAASSSSVEVSVEGSGVLQKATYVQPISVSMADAAPGIDAMWAGAFDETGAEEAQAGGHPRSAISFFLPTTVLAPNGRVIPAGDPKDIHAYLPPGFIGNPLVTKRCPQNDLGCLDPNAAVGNLGSSISAFGAAIAGSSGPAIYNDVPPAGFPAEFTSKIGQPSQSFVGGLRSDDDFGVTVTAPNILSYFKIFGAFFYLEGRPPGANGSAFLTNPTNCAGHAKHAPVFSMNGNTWQVLSPFPTVGDPQPPVVGCNQLDFEPTFGFQVAGSSAATGVSASASLQLDQSGLLDANGLATPHLKKSVVALPEGVVLNPAAADGLEGCSTTQIGLKGTNFAAPNPIRFDKNPVACPDGSRIGTVEVETPLLEAPLAGTVYLAAQDDNPFKSLLAMYLVVEDEKTGTILKLPGKVTPNQKTGQLTAEFDNNPQIPFEDLTLKFRGGGPRSTMATPDVCGKYTTKGTFTPWSAPESGPPAQTEDSFNITTGVGGSAACPQTKAQRPFGLGFEAGTINPVGGASSPFTLRITRPDGNQELDRIVAKMPLGLTAKLAGVEMCSEAALAVALTPGRDGKTEMTSPSCPANSQVGTTTIGAGVGSSPYYVRTGKVYLTGPYKGAPIGLAFIVPAVAGPFDLGVQVVRTALQVNPTTAEITAESDPIPQILEGIPLQIRDVRVDVDRPGFTRNPTSCEPMAVSAQITGGSGAVANVSNRFQVGNCGALGFSPKLKLKYKGATKRSGNPGLRAVLTQPEGQANIAYTQVILPQGSFIDQSHINNPCTRAQFAANACPKSSILGTATAWSPLLDRPLTGYVYFKSNGGERDLPDIVASLKGQVNVDLVGFVDAIENKKKKTSRVRNTFAIVPDAPVTRFELNMKGGKVGLIENSRNLCKGKNKATVRMTAHNGKRIKRQPVVKTDCKRKKPSKGGKKGRADRRGLIAAELRGMSW